MPGSQDDARAVLFETATRYTEDQAALPISPTWFRRLFTDISIITSAETFSAAELTQLQEQQAWREGWLAERILDDILDEQIRIDTEGARPGQINALSVIDFPGHHARSANLHASVALSTLEMVNLPTSSVKQNWAATFMLKE